MTRVLVAILDWGLGHATRSIPVIRELQRQGCEVFIAGSGDSLQLLRTEYPSIPCVILPGYSPRYPTHGSMAFTMALQLPKFASVIRDEHRAIEQIVAEKKIDILVSDNRYGCWSINVPSVFITHQSNIMMPKRFGLLKDVVRRVNETMMNRFSECWVPDLPPPQSLAGELAGFERVRLKVPVRFIGWLSRFEYTRQVEETIDVLAIFSGPEPQRSLLENMVLPQLRASGVKFRAVRGLPGERTASGSDNVVNFLSGKDLQSWIESASLVVARSGYSTIMDMNALGKKVVFIPTPGQTEQEYLAERLMRSGIAFSMSQEAFDLQTAIEESKRFSGFDRAAKNTLLARAIGGTLRPSSTSADKSATR